MHNSRGFDSEHAFLLSPHFEIRLMKKTLSDWTFRQSSAHETPASNLLWLPCAPGTTCDVFVDLLHNRIIQDPLIDDNENSVQWVSKCDWQYKIEFNVSSEAQLYETLHFRGLDTFAMVLLNDELILETDNMFREYRVDVKEFLTTGLNTLIIDFASALNVAEAIEKRRGTLKCWNGDPCRLYVRKAQYHFGWDWGPRLISCGPYRPIILERSSLLVEDIFVEAELKPAEATVSVSFDVKGLMVENLTVRVQGCGFLYTADVKKSGTQKLVFKITNPKLWSPLSPSLYKLSVYLETEEVVASNIGLRDVELVQDALEIGSTFYLKINGESTLCVGSNWIPACSFPAITPRSKYTQLLEEAKAGGHNMVRVWGGGLYEDDFFYQECDRLGLLVWQDFMFSCGQYPGDKAFLKSVEKEVRCQVKRLRMHPCVVLYAGNNEDYQIAEAEGLEWDPDDTSGDYSKTNFPARTIYELLLPSILHELSPKTPYRFGSPYGGTGTRDPTVGDIHQWDVWHNAQLPYQDWPKLYGRFVSEFGMGSLPCYETYTRCISCDLHPQGRMVEHHNKAAGFERRLATYIVENVRLDSFDLRSYIYASQLMQAECISSAFMHWRRLWLSRECGGVLVWQLNDCWPGASWSLIDYYGNRKLAYFAVRRVLGPVALGSRRVGDGVELWGVSETQKLCTLTVTIYDSTTRIKREQVKVVVDGCTTFGMFPVLADHVLHGVLEIHENEQMLEKSTNGENMRVEVSNWPEPLKHFVPSVPHISLDVKGKVAVLASDRPVKGVQLCGITNESDNGFDLFPGHPKTVTFESGCVTLNYYGLCEPQNTCTEV